MATWFDYVSLVFTLGFFIAIIGGAVYVAGMVSSTVESTKANLKKQGLHITDEGLAVKTNKRMDRETYVDNTRAAFVKSSQFISVGNPNDPQKLSPVDAERPELSPRKSGSSGISGILRRKSGASDAS